MIIAYDSETCLTKPGLGAPRLACGSFAWDHGSAVAPRDGALKTLREHLLDPACVIVGQNIAYDFGVACREDATLIPLVFAAYDAGRVSDTMIREQLLDIMHDGMIPVKGHYSLAGLAKRYLNLELDKTTYRTGYGPLFHTDFADWPDGAIEYARADATATLAVHAAQQLRAEKAKYIAGPHHITDEQAQCRAAWALHLMGVWGARTDPASVAALKQRVTTERDSIIRNLTKAGIVRKDGTRDMGKVAKLVEQHCVGVAPMTATGKVQTTREVLLQCDHEKECKKDDTCMCTLHALARFSGLDKIAGTYIPVLEQGTKLPVNAGWRCLVDTGRTSCREPNFQNLPRDGGLRECFVPRPGFVYVSCDYQIAELCSLAQTLLDMFGHSAMAVALQEGRELHLDMAAQLLGISYEEALNRRATREVKDARQLAKAANFGLPGGLGPDKLVQFAYASYGLRLSRDRSVALKEAWLKKYPEMRDYFNRVSDLVGPGQSGTVELNISGRQRGGVGFTNACNSFFQGLTADGAKAALYAVSKECYSVPTSPLYGSRPVFFIHDEIIIEAPEGRLTAAAKRLQSVMESTMAIYTPNIPVVAKPAAMAKWYKNAEPVWVDGELQCWEPKPKDERIAA